MDQLCKRRIPNTPMTSKRDKKCCKTPIEIEWNTLYLVWAVKSYDLDIHPWMQCEIKLVDDIKIFFI